MGKQETKMGRPKLKYPKKSIKFQLEEKYMDALDRHAAAQRMSRNEFLADFARTCANLQLEIEANAWERMKEEAKARKV